MRKECHIIGFPIISKLIRGHTVELETVCFIPDDQLLTESKNEYGCVKFPAPQTSKDEVSPNSAEIKPVEVAQPSTGIQQSKDKICANIILSDNICNYCKHENRCNFDSYKNKCKGIEFVGRKLRPC